MRRQSVLKVTLLSMATLLLGAIAGTTQAAEATSPSATTASVQSIQSKVPCAQCHGDLTKHYLMSKHSVNPNGPGLNCATCHGEVLRHMSNPMKEKPQFTFAKSKDGLFDEASRAAADKVCTSCHNKDAQRHWEGSIHQQNGVACVSCHTNHKADIALNPKTNTALCLSCHKDQKANLFKSSTHPILSGQMNCVSCHNPHGTKAGGEALLNKDTVNDTCFTCHPGKRGPFVHPHQPVTEDCGNCHNPHGSNKGAMLTMRTPALCISCHAGAHHNDAATNRTSCLTCHNQVHGSNNANGKGLTQ